MKKNPKSPLVPSAGRSFDTICYAVSCYANHSGRAASVSRERPKGGGHNGQKKSSAFVLLFSLMIISIIIMMTEQMIRGVMVGSNFTKTMVDREHAEMLALGGINIAIAQLTYKDDKKAKEKEQAQVESGVIKPESESDEDGKGDGKKVTPFKRFIFNLISNLNRWQTFELDPKIDGVAGTVKICITSEHGKININHAFDFKKQEFKKEFIALLGGLEIQGKLKPGEFLNKISEYLKNRSKKLYDVSELLNVAGLENFNMSIFYDPPKSFKRDTKPNSDLTLQDIFTTWTDDKKIDIMLLSDALCAILGITRPRADDAKKYKEKFKQVAMDFKDDWGKDWDANWKHLEPIYGSKPKLLSSIKDILVEKFKPKVYSVLSYGKVGQVEQRLLAIIKEIQIEDKKEKGKVNEQSGQAQKPQDEQRQTKVFKIERIYWI
jgi:hypothetical protein